MRNKRGQMKLSFGMIFSIFLIIAFIAFAFFAIKKFVFLQKDIEHQLFFEHLEAEVEDMWRSSYGSFDFEDFLPSSINSVCFVEQCSDLGLNYRCSLGGDNLIFNSTKKDYGSFYVSNLNMTGILGDKRMLCIKTNNGKVKMTLKKNYNEATVTITP